MEKICTERKLLLADMSLKEQNALWDEAKRELGDI
jgi:uncharacterized protein YabN with tetrapyrrole methylase and pyrophosphatase domain